MRDSSVQDIANQIYNCDTLAQLEKEILPVLIDTKVMWKRKINEIYQKSCMTKERFSSLCGVSRMTLDKWLKGALPQSRERYIQIGFVANYNLDEMNQFLRQYGKYSELYPKKSLEDCIYIFVLTSPDMVPSFQRCEEIMQKVEAELSNELNMEDTTEQNDEIFSTVRMMDRLASLKTEIELWTFIAQMKSSYEQRYYDLYEYARSFIDKNCEIDSRTQKRKYADLILGFRSSIQKHMYAILKKKWIPLRGQVIEIGVALNMTLEQINKMLALAKMDPMNPRNPMECVIMYGLIDAELNDMIVSDGRDDLYDYVTQMLQYFRMSWDDR